MSDPSILISQLLAKTLVARIDVHIMVRSVFIIILRIEIELISIITRWWQVQMSCFGLNLKAEIPCGLTGDLSKDGRWVFSGWFSQDLKLLFDYSLWFSNMVNNLRTLAMKEIWKFQQDKHLKHSRNLLLNKHQNQLQNWYPTILYSSVVRIKLKPKMKC